jgi:hypothetical protein|tara:strand:- start:1544 stop:2224 length:681 start_codon:yes stop_codon:yes gene_type:complete
MSNDEPKDPYHFIDTLNNNNNNQQNLPLVGKHDGPSNYELMEEEKKNKKREGLLQPRNPINKIIASEDYYTIPVDTKSRTSNNDYIFLRNTNPRIAIFVEGFKHDPNDNMDGDNIYGDNIYGDLCEPITLCNDPSQLYIKLSSNNYLNIGNRGKEFNKLIKQYDNYKGDKPYSWRMRNLFTGSEKFGKGGKKKTKRKKRKHVKSKKSRKIRKHVKSRKQRKSRRKN